MCAPQCVHWLTSVAGLNGSGSADDGYLEIRNMYKSEYQIEDEQYLDMEDMAGGQGSDVLAVLLVTGRGSRGCML